MNAYKLSVVLRSMSLSATSRTRTLVRQPLVSQYWRCSSVMCRFKSTSRTRTVGCHPLASTFLYCSSSSSSKLAQPPKALKVETGCDLILENAHAKPINQPALVLSPSSSIGKVEESPPIPMKSDKDMSITFTCNVSSVS